MKVTTLLFFVLLCAVGSFLINFRYLQSIQATSGSQKSTPTKKIKNQKNKYSNEKKTQEQGPHQVAGLDCSKYGGPYTKEATSKMVYWRDIPSDALYKSPYQDFGPIPKYLTFEPDEGDWNNQRMSMETAVVMAVAMGRILVLPPEQQLIFDDIFHFDDIFQEHSFLQMISMEDFLKREGLTGHLKDTTTGQIVHPPENNRVDYDKDMRRIWDGHPLWPYLRRVATKVPWEKDSCVAVMSGKPGGDGVQSEKQRWDTYMEQANENANRQHMFIRIESFTGNPTRVDAPPQDRLREQLGRRSKLCVYDEQMQTSTFLHAMGDNDSGARLLTHFYALLFFEDWRQDLWMKRFVRDHFRYVDELQCAAARIVKELGQLAKKHADEHDTTTTATTDGEYNYDSMHVRRGDFLQFQKGSNLNATDIYRNVRSVLRENSTIYIATDERDKLFFDPLREHYHLYFLDDFQQLTMGMSTSKFGMLDQLVASRGLTFVGLFYSTFTGYINRMRAYHAQKEKATGYDQGVVQSYFYAERRFKYAMRSYHGMDWPIWAREYPTAWRDIDHDVLEPDIA